MRLYIADWELEIDCAREAFDRLLNFEPFLVSENAPSSASVLCRIETAVGLSDESIDPLLIKEFDGRILTLWLTPDYCSVSLAYTESGSVFRLQADRCWKHVRTDWNSFMKDADVALNDIIMLSFTYSSAFCHTVLLHASCIDSPYGGCAFIGPSGIGKSTHSRLWLEYVPDCRLLNDDQPVIRQLSDGHLYIYGSPWSGKTACYCNDKAQLKALFFMQQAADNRVTRLHGLQVFQKLVEATSAIGSDIKSFSGISEMLAFMAGTIPGYLLENRADQDSVRLSHQIMAAI